VLGLKLAYRNIMGAGLRTWLNVIVLSITYVLIIWHQGFFSGMLREGERNMIKDDVAGGQYWYKGHDPYDPVSIEESHGILPPRIRRLVDKNSAAPILIRPAAIYPNGRMQSILIKGIDPGQKILDIPAKGLETDHSTFPVMIGKRMAGSNRLKIGDDVTIRLRDSHGTFDAVLGEIVQIMDTQVATIDTGQLWVPLRRLQEITRMENEATIVVVGTDITGLKDSGDWGFKDQDFLLKDLNEMVISKRVSAGIMYSILLFLAMLAVFDTQVLAIFRRRKEIGTLIALGMTRMDVISIFTFEGMLHGILAIGAGAIYGIPLLIISARKGFPLPQATDSYGFALSQRLFPYYTVSLVLITVISIMITVTIVSFLPTKKIARLKPTDALKGKIS